jgi:hypothetical protein
LREQWSLQQDVSLTEQNSPEGLFDDPGILFVKGFIFCYFDLLAFSALNFLQRSFVNFEILALPAADMVRLRLTPLALTSFELTGAECEPFSARIAP